MKPWPLCVFALLIVGCEAQGPIYVLSGGGGNITINASAFVYSDNFNQGLNTSNNVSFLDVCAGSNCLKAAVSVPYQNSAAGWTNTSSQTSTAKLVFVDKYDAQNSAVTIYNTGASDVNSAARLTLQNYRNGSSMTDFYTNVSGFSGFRFFWIEPNGTQNTTYYSIVKTWGARYLKFMYWNGSQEQNALTINEGRIGFNTTAPAASFHFYGNALVQSPSATTDALVLKQSSSMTAQVFQILGSDDAVKIEYLSPIWSNYRTGEATASNMATRWYKRGNATNSTGAAVANDEGPWLGSYFWNTTAYIRAGYEMLWQPTQNWNGTVAGTKMTWFGNPQSSVTNRLAMSLYGDGVLVPGDQTTLTETGARPLITGHSGQHAGITFTSNANSESVVAYGYDGLADAPLFRVVARTFTSTPLATLINANSTAVRLVVDAKGKTSIGSPARLRDTTAQLSVNAANATTTALKLYQASSATVDVLGIYTSDGLKLTNFDQNGFLNVSLIYLNNSNKYAACSVANEGAIVYNNTARMHYGCNSTAWNPLY